MLGKALRIGLVFGLFEAIMPGDRLADRRGGSDLVQPVGSWVAFALLAVVGGHMLWEAWRGSRDERCRRDARRRRAGRRVRFA